MITGVMKSKEGGDIARGHNAPPTPEGRLLLLMQRDAAIYSRTIGRREDAGGAEMTKIDIRRKQADQRRGKRKRLARIAAGLKVRPERGRKEIELPPELIGRQVSGIHVEHAHRGRRRRRRE